MHCPEQDRQGPIGRGGSHRQGEVSTPSAASGRNQRSSIGDQRGLVAVQGAEGGGIGLVGTSDVATSVAGDVSGACGARHPGPWRRRGLPVLGCGEGPGRPGGPYGTSCRASATIRSTGCCSSPTRRRKRRARRRRGPWPSPEAKTAPMTQNTRPGSGRLVPPGQLGARAQAEEHLERIPPRGEAERRKALDQAEGEAAARTREKEEEAERARSVLVRPSRRPTGGWPRPGRWQARPRRPPQGVASQAAQEAERLAALAQDLRRHGGRLARQARRGSGRRPPPAGARGARSGRTAGSAAGRGRATGNGGQCHTAQERRGWPVAGRNWSAWRDELDVADASTMNKQDLVEAVVQVGGVPLDELNEGELLRLGRGTGAELRTSMTKPELIVVAGHRVRQRRGRHGGARVRFHMRGHGSDQVVRTQEQMDLLFLDPSRSPRQGHVQRHCRPRLQGHARRRRRGRSRPPPQARAFPPLRHRDES